jgi:hypothetical protein
MLSELSNAAELTQLTYASKQNLELVKQHMLKGDKNSARNAKARVDRAANRAAILAQQMGSLAAAKNAAKVRANAVQARKYYTEHKFGRFILLSLGEPRKFGRFTLV